MQRHEYYEELCALLPIGQLTVEEHQDLAEHLKRCASCRNATDDFSAILDKMPFGDMDVDERALSVSQNASYRLRFLRRAINDGVPLSAAVINSPSFTKNWRWPRFRMIPIFAAATCVIIAVFSIQLGWLKKERSHPGPQLIVRNEQLPASTGKDQTEGLVSELELRLKALRNQSTQEQGVISDLESKLSTSRVDSRAATERLTATMQQLAQIKQEAGETERSLDQAKIDLSRLRSERDGADAELAEQQYKITELTAQVKEKDALAERERQLNAVTRDIRDLMGARSLHILDVSDVDGNGRSSKSFGRVFLVEGKSLIFYAFDLGDRGNPSKVSFQAWAQSDARQTLARSLGVFYVDDHAQKRWVLKVNDPEKLREISSVFVTVEPLGGTERPTGKKLLNAYLGTKPNHP